MVIDYEIYYKGNLYVYVCEMGYMDFFLFV